MNNESGIWPTEYKVLIVPEEISGKHKFKGPDGKEYELDIPDETKDRYQFAVMKGVLIASSPLAFTYDDWNGQDASKPKPGDSVLFAKYAGALVDGKDGKKYRIVNDKDIAAVLS